MMKSMIETGSRSRVGPLGKSSRLNSMSISRTISVSNKPQVVYSISSDIIKKARFMVGDKVDILFDKNTKEGLIKRAKEGYSLSNNGGKNTKNSRTSIKFTWYQGMPIPLKYTEITDFKVTDDGIEFKYPDSIKFVEI